MNFFAFTMNVLDFCVERKEPILLHWRRNKTKQKKTHLFSVEKSCKQYHANDTCSMFTIKWPNWMYLNPKPFGVERVVWKWKKKNCVCEWQMFKHWIRDPLLNPLETNIWTFKSKQIPFLTEISKQWWNLHLFW